MLQALSFTSSRLTVGVPWVIRVLSTLDDGTPGGDVPELTVTDPAGADHVLTVEAWESVTGVWVATYVPAVPGRHLALAGADPWALYFVGEAYPVTDAAAMPDVDACSNYMGEHSWSDAEIQDALDQETGAQFDVCRIPAAYPPALRGALLRRVQRNLAMRNLALAVKESVDGESSIVLPGRDPEVRRFEAPYRKLPIG